MSKEIRKTKKQKKEIELPAVKNYLIQSNTVTNSINDFTLYQERIFNAIIFHLQEPINLDKNGLNYKQLNLFDSGSVVVKIPLKEISEPRNYPVVKNAIKDMSTSPVQFSYIDEKGKAMEYTSGLFSATMPAKGNGGGHITVKFDAVVAEILIRIQKDSKGNPIQYTKYMYQIAQSVKTPYASKLYKLISSWKKKGGFYISREELYKRMGIKPGEYESNYDFMRRIIIPAHEQLFEKADCWFNCKAKDFIKREGDKPKGKVLGFNFKVITPEFEELETKKFDQIFHILRTHFKCNDADILEVSRLLDNERANYERVMNKILQLSEKIGNSKEIPNKNRYVVTSLVNEFGN